MVIQFKVNESRLSQLSASWVVSNAYNYIRAQFNFVSDDWDEKGKTAVFSYNGREWPVTLDRNNSCRVPHEVLQPPQFQVYLVGGSTLSEVITTNNCPITVHPSSSNYNYYGCCSGSPDIYQQIIDVLEGKQDKLTAGDNIEIDQYGKVSVADEFVDDINTKFATIEAARVDNIMFNKESNELWLVHDGEQIGDKIVLGAWVQSAVINEQGNLIVTYSDGTEQNLGSMATSGGKSYVYVPTISNDKILTLTLAEEPTVESVSCDLNPFDEWTEIDGPESGSTYTWEEL